MLKDVSIPIYNRVDSSHILHMWSTQTSFIRDLITQNMWSIIYIYKSARRRQWLRK